MAVKLSSSYLRHSFQLLAFLSTERFPAVEAFDRASNIIYEWAKRKFAHISQALPARKESMSVQKDGNELGILFHEDRNQFILRVSHPDSNIAGRRWITDVQLQQEGQQVRFAVRLSVSSLHSCCEEVPVSTPEFVRLIFSNIGITDVQPLLDTPLELTSAQDMEDFIPFLEDPRRLLPVVMVTPCVDPESGETEYIMDPTELAADLKSQAHVVALSDEAASAMTGLVGRTWSVFHGGVRTYYDQLSFQESSPYSHPLMTAPHIRLRNGEDESDPLLAMHELEHYIQLHNVTARPDWDSAGIRFYLAANQEYLTQRRLQSTQSYAEQLQGYEAQVSELQTQSEENLALADSMAQDLDDAKARLDEEHELNQKLRIKIDILEHRLSLCSTCPEESIIPDTPTYEDLASWAGEHFPDRLRLLPRAQRSLKSACYEDISLVYRCLELLATHYYAYQTGTCTYEQFMDACHQVDPGLDEAASISKESAGLQGDIYFVKYKGCRKKLERHLTKGSNKDRRFCMRIYFFWDNDDELVVVGDLPHHLRTTAT